MPQDFNLKLPGRRQVISGGIGLGVLLTSGLSLAAGHPLLRISFGEKQPLELTEESFSALPWQTLRTHTFWTDGPQEFRGPTLRELMSLVLPAEELRGRVMRMTALNDFQVEIPGEDLFTLHPIVAREMNGQPMLVRDKGPLWLVYPRDDHPELQNPAYDERWIWQLSTIQVL